MKRFFKRSVYLQLTVFTADRAVLREVAGKTSCIYEPRPLAPNPQRPTAVDVVLALRLNRWLHDVSWGHKSTG